MIEMIKAYGFSKIVFSKDALVFILCLIFISSAEPNNSIQLSTMFLTTSLSIFISTFFTRNGYMKVINRGLSKHISESMKNALLAPIFLNQVCCVVLTILSLMYMIFDIDSISIQMSLLVSTMYGTIDLIKTLIKLLEYENKFEAYE